MKQQVLVSDLSGNEIPQEDALRIRVLGYPDESADTELDVSYDEVENLLRGKGRVLKKRGRKPSK